MPAQLQIKHELVTRTRSVVQLCASPVSARGVVADFVVGSISDPVRQWTVRLDLFGIAGLLTE